MQDFLLTRRLKTRNYSVQYVVVHDGFRKTREQKKSIIFCIGLQIIVRPILFSYFVKNSNPRFRVCVCLTVGNLELFYNCDVIL